MNYDALADIYDHQYDLYRDDLHFYAGLAEGRQAVLEVGAGTGRVTTFLARRGVPITGLEPSAEMLQRAKKRAEGQRVTWLHGDAAGFCTDARFDLIIAPFNALMHLYTPEEQLEALQNLRAHLTPDGLFAFDLYVPRFGKQHTLRHEGETFFEAGQRTDVTLMQRQDKVAQTVTTEYLVDTAPIHGGPLNRRFFTLRQRYYTRFEVEWLLRCAGFMRPRVQGSFQGGPLTAQSDVMVFSACPQQ